MFSLFFQDPSKTKMVSPEEALPGRDQAIAPPTDHHVLGTPVGPPYPEGLEEVVVAMGCFWGAERKFWQADGVYTTAVGYAGGYTKNPTYQEVCSAKTGHTEVVKVVFDPAKTNLAAILKIFWESHDPTQGMRQGNDVGTQYRSAIYTTTPEQEAVVEETRAAFQKALTAGGLGEITTEIAPAGEFYFAEEYHQQYLSKNPGGYCGLGGTGVTCQVGVGVAGD
jgi:peptide-methionine (S)-S-oxide reductase